MTEETPNYEKLSTDELYEVMQDDLYDGLIEKVEGEVNECLRRDIEPIKIMHEGLVAGMKVVGEDFKEGILFVPEVLMAAKSMKAGMAILKPLLIEEGIPQVGTAVIGTVKGDIHDIGKNLVAMMWEGAGINVIDLGINTDADAFIQALEENNADILGMSALLTTTMPYMKVVIDTLKERDIRDKYTVLVGGAPLNDAFAEQIQADAYCKDAAVAVEMAESFLAMKK
jgi:5-methyltetrahydrofolate--homocysteine methyltransferase